MRGARTKDSPARSGERQRAVPLPSPRCRSGEACTRPHTQFPVLKSAQISGSLFRLLREPAHYRVTLYRPSPYPKIPIGFTSNPGNTLAMSTAPNPTTCRANTDASTLR